MPERDRRSLWRYYLLEVLDHWKYILFGLVVGAGVAWWWIRGLDTKDAGHAVVCRQMYDLARSAADTARVDAVYPLGPGEDNITCGRIRALGLLE